MKIRALKTTAGSYGLLPRGKTADVPDWEAKDMIAAGYATAVIPDDKLPAVPRVSAASQNANPREASDADPFTAPRTGGQNGEVKQSPSSQVGRQRQKRRSTSRKGDAG